MVKAILDGSKTHTRRLRKQYYSAGDVLYVRENTMFHPCNNWLYKAGMGRVKYCADMTDREMARAKNEGWKIKPSIHVPKVFSRIKLMVIRVWEERLQDISDEDAQAEGTKLLVSYKKLKVWGRPAEFGYLHKSYREAFMYLWDSINAKGGHGWDTNPIVYATEFSIKEVKDGGN